MTDIQKKIESLARERRRILALTPKKAMEAILASPDGLVIVHSMADQDFHLLVNEIGPEDALELLSMASNRQWEHILDIEAWDRETILGKPVVKWFDLFMQADEDRFIDWMTGDKSDFLELFLSYHVEAGIRVHDQDPSDIEDDFFTFDDIHYIRFVSRDVSGSVIDEKDADVRDRVLYRFLRRLAETDHRTFQQILYYTAGVLPAEAEEETYRLRNVRLAEKGLLPFAEAVGIYQTAVKDRALPRKPGTTAIVDTGVPVPLTHNSLLPRETVFSQALVLVDSAETLIELQGEFAALCNRLAVADGLTVKGKQDLAAIVRKACGYLHIGFTELTGKDSPDPHKAALIMQTHFLADIFRTGYSRVARLRNRADKWYRGSWCRQNNLPVSFWGEDRQGVLGGLLVKRPLFFDIDRGGLFREFERPVEVSAAESLLEQIMALDILLSQAKIDPRPVSYEVLTVENLLLTLWARHSLDLPETVDFIPIRDFRPFFEELMAAVGNTPGGVIADEKKESFLAWLSAKTGRDPLDIVRSVGPVLEDMFAAVAGEYGPVAPKEIDPRHIHLFLVC